MKTLILSDLHDDFWFDKGRDPFAPCEDLVGGLEAIVLAGDISNKPRVRWKYAFERLRSRFGAIPIYVFPGNHDFYDWRLLDEDRLAEIAASFDISYAQTSSFVLGRTRLICATLWTDLELGLGRELNEHILAQKMNDYRYIRLGAGSYRRIAPDHTLQVHRVHRRFIKETLDRPHEGPSVVVTHHAPHPEVMMEYGENLDGAYASDLSEILTGHSAPDKWLFGHCHDAKRARIGQTDLHPVSLGYPTDIPTNEEVRARISGAIFEL